ncbi:MAG: hypothetical protein ABIN74_10795 [Ferruginibacter sp.]
MKYLFFIAGLFLSASRIQAQNVGIGTSTPLQKLHVVGSTFLNGNVGVGENTPAFPLSFGPALGDKISLWSNSSNSYGFGIQSGLLQIHSDGAASDIAFGYGSSNSFTERARIINNGTDGMILNGRLHIKNGSYPLDVNETGGVWLYRSDNSAPLGFLGTQNNQNIGFYGGPANGGWGFVYDAVNSRVGIGTSNPSQTLHVEGTTFLNGYVGIGNSNPGYQLDINNRMRIRSGGNNSVSAGLWLNNNANAETAFIGMEDDTHVGFFGIGTGWKFGMNTQTGALKVNGTEGLTGQVLISNGSSAPSWGSPTNSLYNSTAQVFSITNIAITTSSVWVPIPDLSYTFNATGNVKIIVMYNVHVFPGPCVNCGSTGAMIGVYIDGVQYGYWYEDVSNGAYIVLSSSYLGQIGAGSHTIELRGLKQGPSAFFGGNASTALGQRRSNMIVQVIPQ